MPKGELVPSALPTVKIEMVSEPEPPVDQHESILFETTDTTNYMELIVMALSENNLHEANTLNELRNQKLRVEDARHCEISVEDLYLIAKVIEAEAGSSWLSDEHQLMVGSVLLNRVNSPEFPNTVTECVYQKGQYYSETNTFFAGIIPSIRAIENALLLLEHGSIAPAEVVFQSNFKQGSGVYMVIEDDYLKTSYFCFSSYPDLYINTED